MVYYSNDFEIVGNNLPRSHMAYTLLSERLQCIGAHGLHADEPVIGSEQHGEG